MEIHLLPHLLLLLAACTRITAAAAATAAAPEVTTAPPSNITTAMAKHGCKAFASLLSSNPAAMSTFDGVVTGGLTVFCPSDSAVASFMPTYKNLTADGKESLLLYHAVPVYNSMGMLKTSNGEFNTLATDGVTRNFNFTVQDAGDVVTLKSGVVTSTITGTVVDRQPLAIFRVDAVLRPTELFKVVQPPAPAPAPADKPEDVTSAPTPAGPEEAPADQKAADDTSAAVVHFAGRWVVVAVAAAMMWSMWT